MIDKQKLETCLQDIAAKSQSSARDITLERTVIIDPGETTPFTYRCRARHTFRRESSDIKFEVRWEDEKGGKSGRSHVHVGVETVPATTIVSAGAAVGALSGVVVRWAFVSS